VPGFVSVIISASVWHTLGTVGAKTASENAIDR